MFTLILGNLLQTYIFLFFFCCNSFYCNNNKKKTVGFWRGRPDNLPLRDTETGQFSSVHQEPSCTLSQSERVQRPLLKLMALKRSGLA